MSETLVRVYRTHQRFLLRLTMIDRARYNITQCDLGSRQNISRREWISHNLSFRSHEDGAFKVLLRTTATAMTGAIAWYSSCLTILRLLQDPSCDQAAKESQGIPTQLRQRHIITVVAIERASSAPFCLSISKNTGLRPSLRPGEPCSQKLWYGSQKT
jgi:hypothetical protein